MPEYLHKNASDSAIDTTTVPEASTITDVSAVPHPPPNSPHPATAATATMTPNAPIPEPVPAQRMVVSPSWIQDPLRYKTTMPPPTAVPAATMITPETHPIFVHVRFPEKSLT